MKMTTQDIIDESLTEKRFGNYWIGKVHSVIDAGIVKTAEEYKTQKLRKLIPITREEISERDFGREIIVMIKRDGEYNLFDFNSERDEIKSIFCNTPNARGRHGLPVNLEMEKRIHELNKTQGKVQDKIFEILKNAGIILKNDITQITIAGELWADVEKSKGQRPRVFDFIRISRQPENTEDLNSVKYDVFDIISINNTELLDIPYKTRLEICLHLFPSSTDTKANTIPFKIVHKKHEIQELYEKWVVDQGEEGLVVKGYLGYKIKPVKDLDVAIIGFSEMLDHDNMVRSVLVALMHEDGGYQVTGTVGGGFTFDERGKLFSEFQALKVDSDYIHTTRDGRLLTMIRPDPKYIIKIEYMDFITENAKGEPIQRMALVFKDGSWRREKLHSFVSLISPRYKRFRDDKELTPADLRIEQLGKDLDTLLPETPDEGAMVPSTLLFRAVFLGKYRGTTTLQKYMIWKTNKEKYQYPSYMTSLVNYNFDRKEPLQFDLEPNAQLEKAIESVERVANGRMGCLSGKTGKLKRGWKLHALHGQDSMVEKIRETCSDALWKAFNEFKPP